jgi:hypothetical protein
VSWDRESTDAPLLALTDMYLERMGAQYALPRIDRARRKRGLRRMGALVQSILGGYLGRKRVVQRLSGDASYHST